MKNFTKKIGIISYNNNFINIHHYAVLVPENIKQKVSLDVQ